MSALVKLEAKYCAGWTALVCQAAHAGARKEAKSREGTDVSLNYHTWTCLNQRKRWVAGANLWISVQTPNSDIVLKAAKRAHKRAKKAILV